MVLWRPTRPSKTNTQKDVLFIIGNWNAKVGSQETPGVTGKFGLGIRNEAGQRLIEFCQENTLVIANTFVSSIQSAKTRLGADCGSDHEFLICQIQTLKKIGKTTRPFRYDLNLSPAIIQWKWPIVSRHRSDRPGTCTTMDRDLWHCTGGSDQDHPQEKEMQKGKMVVRGGLTNSWEKKRSEKQRRKKKKR